MSKIYLKLKILDEGLRPPWLADKESGVPIILPDAPPRSASGRPLAVFEGEGIDYPAVTEIEGKTVFNFDPDRAMSYIMNEEYRGRKIYDGILKAGRLGAMIPGSLRKYLKRLSYLAFGPKRKTFPSWPVEESVELIRHLLIKTGRTAAVRWPQGKAFALALTHDVDSVKGLSNATCISRAEERRGVVSTWFVPADVIRAGAGEVKDLAAKGHEIGLHGASHDHAYSSPETERIKLALDGASDVVRQFDIKGFRSPYLGRSKGLFSALEGYFRYDSSVPDTALLSPEPYPNGSCSVFPYRIGRLQEMPITLPLDSSLIFLGYDAEKALDIWKKKTEWVRQVGGVAVLVTHAEPHFVNSANMLKTYEKFMDWAIGQDDVWITGLSEIADVFKYE